MIVTCPNCGKSAKFMPWTSPEGKVLPAAMCLTSGAWLVMTLPQLWQDALELLDMYGLHPYMATASPYNGIDFFVGSENDPKRIQIFNSWGGGISNAISAHAKLDMSEAEGWHDVGDGWMITI